MPEDRFLIVYDTNAYDFDKSIERFKTVEAMDIRVKALLESGLCSDFNPKDPYYVLLFAGEIRTEFKYEPQEVAIKFGRKEVKSDA